MRKRKLAPNNDPTQTVIKFNIPEKKVHQESTCTIPADICVHIFTFIVILIVILSTRNKNGHFANSMLLTRNYIDILGNNLQKILNLMSNQKMLLILLKVISHMFQKSIFIVYFVDYHLYHHLPMQHLQKMVDLKLHLKPLKIMLYVVNAV